MSITPIPPKLELKSESITSARINSINMIVVMSNPLFATRMARPQGLNSPPGAIYS